MPVEARYFSASFAVERGSRPYGCIVLGSMMSQRRFTVVSSRNGSTTGVSSSGSSIMSDSLIDFHPEMDDPSNMIPSANMSRVDPARGNRGVLLLAPRVGKPQVHPLGIVVADQLDGVFRHFHFSPAEPLLVLRINPAPLSRGARPHARPRKQRGCPRQTGRRSDFQTRMRQIRCHPVTGPRYRARTSIRSRCFACTARTTAAACRHLVR